VSDEKREVGVVEAPLGPRPGVRRINERPTAACPLHSRHQPEARSTIEGWILLEIRQRDQVGELPEERIDGRGQGC
jgi:hypothetical protein